MNCKHLKPIWCKGVWQKKVSLLIPCTYPKNKRKGPICFLPSFVEWWGPPDDGWECECRKVGGTWCSLLHIGTPLPQNLLQFLYLVYLYFIVLYFLYVRNLISWNPQFEHTIHRLVLYAFCLWGNAMYKIHCKYPAFQQSTSQRGELLERVF